MSIPIRNFLDQIMHIYDDATLSDDQKRQQAKRLCCAENEVLNQLNREKERQQRQRQGRPSPKRPSSLHPPPAPPSLIVPTSR